jgi:hypothetical protein
MLVYVLSARLSLELSECKEWIRLYKVRRKPWGLSVSPAIIIDPPAWCGAARTLYAGDVETPLVEKLLSGAGIKVTKRAWQVPKWLAFVASKVVLLGETW